MPPFLTDANIARDFIRGLLRRNPEIDVTRVQDVGLRQAEDRRVLAWAAEYGCVLLTRDRKTVPPLAYERIRNGQVMPGIVVMSMALSIGAAIEEVTLLIQCTRDDEWENQVYHLPL